MTAEPAQRPSDFALMLPPGWARLPVGVAARPAVARLVSARFGQLASEQRARARRSLREQILGLVDDGEQAGGIEVLLCVEPIAGRAVSGSCLVSFVAGRGGEVDFAVLLIALDGDGESWQPVEVAGGLAGRRAVRETQNDGADGVPSTRVDFLVPVPGSDAQLLLAFATVTDQVAQEMTALFDAIAGSLRWVYGR